MNKMKNFPIVSGVVTVPVVLYFLFGLTVIEKSQAFHHHLHHHQSYSMAKRKMTSTLNNNNKVLLGRGEEVTVRWNPAQAAEFVTWHVQGPEKAGLQLAPMIQHWSGNDVGEFLTRMYLGEIDEEKYTITYHPSNVRNPQWIGLDNNAGDGESHDNNDFDELTGFFFKALPPESLLPEEITKFAIYFLLKEHRWPSKVKTTTATKNNNKEKDKSKKRNNESFESDSFQQRGHAATIARIIGFVRNERLGYLTPEDVIAMVKTATAAAAAVRDEKDNNNNNNKDTNATKDGLFVQLNEFYSNLGIKLTSMEKIIVVEGLANAGCSPGVIARLVSSSIEEITEDERLVTIRHKKTLKEASIITTSTSISNISPSTPVQTPLSEIISPSGTKELGEFEARWLPEELLSDEEQEQEQEKVLAADSSSNSTPRSIATTAAATRTTAAAAEVVGLQDK